MAKKKSTGASVAVDPPSVYVGQNYSIAAQGLKAGDAVTVTAQIGEHTDTWDVQVQPDGTVQGLTSTAHERGTIAIAVKHKGTTLASGSFEAV